MRLELGKKGVCTLSSFASFLSLGSFLFYTHIFKQIAIFGSQRGNSDFHMIASNATTSRF